jgi:hypothetical protein
MTVHRGGCYKIALLAKACAAESDGLVSDWGIGRVWNETGKYSI